MYCAVWYDCMRMRARPFSRWLLWHSVMWRWVARRAGVCGCGTGYTVVHVWRAWLHRVLCKYIHTHGLTHMHTLPTPSWACCQVPAVVRQYEHMGGVNDFIRTQAITQSLNITAQLNAGMRFFDFRMMLQFDLDQWCVGCVGVCCAHTVGVRCLASCSWAAVV